MVNLIKFQFKVAYPYSLTNGLNNVRTMPLFGCGCVCVGEVRILLLFRPCLCLGASILASCYPAIRPRVHMKESPLALKRSA